MAFSSTRPGALIGINRLRPVYGDEIGDLTAGGNNNLQQYLDLRRNYRGTVADVAARNALTGLASGQFVVVLNAGNGVGSIDAYNGTAWVVLSPFSGITDTQVAAAAAIAWSKISKTGSSLADLTTRSATDLTSGTLPDARFPTTLPALSGVNLTALNGSNIASGTVADARLSAQVVLKNVAAVMAAKLTTTAPTATNAGFNLATGANPTTPADGDLWYNGTQLQLRITTTSHILLSHLSNLNANNLGSGTVPLARLAGITNTEIAAAAGIVDTKLATIATAGKVANSATTGTAANTANTLVLRDANGRAAFADPSAAQDVATKNYTDTRDARHVFNEVPSGTKNGVNVTFTLANAPAAGSLALFLNGILLVPTVHYNLSGSTITYVSTFQPAAAETHSANYRY